MTARYDYIIAGGGSAGCVLAARLSEDIGKSVLLLEAGLDDRHPFHHIPAGYTKLSYKKVTWGYSTVPQARLNGRELVYPQAKVVGGGSSINAMIYTRGARSDYDEWAELGCFDWSYDQVLPYFRKSENNQRLADEYHGTDGPLRVSDPISLHPITRTMVKAAQQIGVPFTADVNGAHQEGVWYHQLTTVGGRRASTAVCYLAPALKRKNLTLITGASCERILVEEGRAIGVLFRRDRGGRETALADAEVLITAGAIGSPKLLMISGVGPAEHLAAAGIETVTDLPGVGQNLQEHLNIPITAELTGPQSYYGRDQILRQAWWSLQYLLWRSGPLTTNVGEAGGFARTSPGLVEPDVQFHLMAALVAPHGLERVAAYGVTVASNVLRPKSRGTVRLAGPDPAAPPRIDPNFLADSSDLERGIAGVQLCRAILAAPALAARIKREMEPGQDVQSIIELAAYARRAGKMDYHPVGTCKMGVDALAVVDQRLRVRGVRSLRVCDASIMPTQISGNTNAPTIMIAERAADFIRGHAE